MEVVGARGAFVSAGTRLSLGANTSSLSGRTQSFAFGSVVNAADNSADANDKLQLFVDARGAHSHN